ncbi:MAG: ABC transporter substrate-binding protein [Firmicutes bacterium]|nr:ABC transporter substrate-binding protein [Bacillota bacterium]
MKIIRLLFIFSVTLLFSACQNSDVDRNIQFSGHEYVFTDALGSQVTVDDPQRVVALMGSFAEIWQLAGGELVGVTDDAFDSRNLALSDEIVNVGTFNSPNTEAIINLSADFVLLSSETPEHVKLQEMLISLNITGAYFKVTHFEDYLYMLKICSEITGNSEAYKIEGEDVKRRIDQIISASQDKENFSVLPLITFSGGIRAQNSETMIGKMLKELGCENIADKKPSLLKEFSMEQLILENPDFIFVVPMGNDDKAALENLNAAIESNPAWNGLDAVRNNRYIILEKNMFLYKPNNRWGESYEFLFKTLYE